MLQTEGLGKYGTVGGIGPSSHRGTAGLEHHRPVGTGIGDTLRIGLAVADGEEEIYLVSGLVDQVGNAVAALADTEVIIGESAIREDKGKQHVVDITDMSQMTVPVEGVGMSATDNGIHRIAGQTVFPEDRGLGLFEVRLIPDIHTQLAPLRTPRGEVGLIDGQLLRILIRNELRLTGHRPDMFGIFRLTETHVIITTDGVAIGFKVDVGGDIEVHRTAHILDHQTVTA